MPPKKGGGGGGGGDKKAQLWDAIKIQKLQTVRYGLANAGIVPASRNDDGLTTFMVAAGNGLDRSLAEMIRFYERRDRELRLCLELCTEDDDGLERTSLHLACAGAHVACTRLLIDAAGSLDRDGAFARRLLAKRDGSGKTARELAVGAGSSTRAAQCVEAIDAFLHETSSEEEDAGGTENGGSAGEGDLTSTQRSRLKKLALLEKEQGGVLAAAPRHTGGGPGSSDGVPGGNVGEVGAHKAERGLLPEAMPPPRWPEVAAWAESVKNLRPVCELAVDRSGTAAPPPPAAAAEKEGGGGGESEGGAAPPPPPPSGGEGGEEEGGDAVDPALWYCHTLNRLQLKLGAGALTTLRNDGLAKLTLLTTLIVSGNDLVSLPECIGSLPLKNLDCSRNRLVCLPSSMPAATLELLDASGNQLTSVEPLQHCLQLVTLALDDNALESIEALPFAGLGRLVSLTLSGNRVAELPPGLGDCAKLEVLNVNDNQITEIRCELAQCKKLKELKIDGCPVKDNKVKKYLAQGEMKQLAKYLEKSGAGAGKGGGGGKKGKKK